MRKSKDTVHLFLKHKWFEMIASGIKTEEYRDINHRYEIMLDMMPHPFNNKYVWNNNFLKKVCFHKGYTNLTMIFKIRDITTGRVNSEWSEPTDKEVFIIKLGERLR